LGANENAFNIYGFTPYVMAKLMDMQSQRMGGSVRINGMTSEESKKAATETLATLGKPNFNYQDANGETALMRAAVAGNIITPLLIADAKANVNLQRNDGMTALMLAVVSQPKDASKDVQSTDPAGKKESRSAHADIVKTLLDQGADVTIKNKEGKTARDLAKEIGNEEILELLGGK